MFCGRHNGNIKDSKRDCYCDDWGNCVEKIRAVDDKKENYAICCPKCSRYKSYSCEWIDPRITRDAAHGIKSLVDLIYNKLERPDQYNIVFFIGAGASVSSGIKTSHDIKGFISKNMHIDLDEIKEHFLRFYPEIADVNDINDSKISMEMLLAVAAQKEGRNKIVNLLSKEFPSANDDKPISMGYEILSHLVRHNIVDAVVSTNYDELFEKSLYDEVGANRVAQIAGDQDFDRFNLNDYFEKRRKGEQTLNIVIKPHGTMSAPNFMQFTLDDVINLSKAKFEFLEKLFTNPKTNIVFVGYRNSDPDIQKLLLLVSRRKVNPVYWVLRSTTKVYDSDGAGIFQFLKLTNSLDKRILYNTGNVFDEFMLDLVNKINETVKNKIVLDNYVFLIRHKIRDILFKNDVKESIENKFVLETIIYSLKARGPYYLGSLLDCQRISNYSSLLGTKAKKLLEDMKNRSILMEDNDLIHFKPKIDEVTNSSNELWDGIDRLMSSNLDIKTRTELGQQFADLKSKFNIDILPESRFKNFRFNSSHIIQNHVRFTIETQNLLSDAFSQGKDVRIISETGSWLTKDNIMNFITKKYGRNIKNTVKILLAGSAQIENDSLEKLKGLDCCISLKYINPNDHSEHMTIGDSKAIYFIRRERSTAICPLLIDDQRDIENLKKRFDLLWGKGLGVEMKYFWDPFISEGAIIAIGTRKWHYFKPTTESNNLRRRPGSRNGIAESDYNASYAITNFLSPLTMRKLEPIKMLPVEESMKLNKQIKSLYRENNNFIVIGASCINWLAGEFWSFYKNEETWNDRETVKRGYVFRDEKDKMEIEKIKNIFYESTTDDNKLGIVRYDQGDKVADDKVYEYMRSNNGDDAKDAAVIIKARHPLHNDKTVLLIMGFSDIGTEYSAKFLTGSPECNFPDFEGALKKINKEMDKKASIETIIRVERRKGELSTNLI